MIIRVDPSSPVPVSEQIRAQLATLIGVGTLGAGVQLPTIRQLAADLGVAKATVSKAYDALIRAGMVTADRRRGTTVAAAPTALGRRERASRLDEAAEAFAVTVVQLGVDPAAAWTSFEEAFRRLGGRS